MQSVRCGLGQESTEGTTGLNVHDLAAGLHGGNTSGPAGLLSLGPLLVISLAFLPAWQSPEESDFSQDSWLPPRASTVRQETGTCVAISGVLDGSKESQASSALRGGDKDFASQWEECQRICASVATFNLLYYFLDYGEDCIG